MWVQQTPNIYDQAMEILCLTKAAGKLCSNKHIYLCLGSEEDKDESQGFLVS